MSPRRRPLLAPLRQTSFAAPLALVLASCAGGNLASEIAAKPAYEPSGQTKSNVEKSHARPLIVEWPSADRATLEAETKAAIVLVRYDGETIELLSDCHAPGGYTYTATTPSEERETVHDVDDLHAKLPLGAAGLQAVLARAGSLDVSMTIVGRYKADHVTVRASELTGTSCARATHAVTALSAGAFEMFAGAQAEVGAGAHVEQASLGAKSTSNRELLHKGGDKAACAKASAEDKAPPYGCGALIRIEVEPIAREDAAALANDGKPATPGGTAAAATAAVSGTAATSVSAAGSASAVASAAPVDEGHFGSLPGGTIESVLAKHGSKMRTCYINGLTGDPQLSGRVRVAFVIGAEGTVTSATDAGSDLPDKDVIGCILSVIKQARFPKPDGGSVKAVYPITFTPQG